MFCDHTTFGDEFLELYTSVSICHDGTSSRVNMECESHCQSLIKKPSVLRTATDLELNFFIIEKQGGVANNIVEDSTYLISRRL